jgi:hypothetical protein
VSDYHFTLFMKIIIWFVVGILTWYIYGNINLMVNNHPVRTSTYIDLFAWPTPKKMEIGCHNEYPMSEECIKSIVKRRHCDLDRLAYAVAMHETANCTVWTGKVNNCHGMLIRVNGKRVPIVYKSKQESYEAFKKLWVRRYGGCPDMAKAIKYSGSDRPQEWLYNVNHYLYE